MQDSSQDTNNGISDIYHTHTNTQTNKTLTILLYGYNSTRTLIDCFLVTTRHYFVLNTVTGHYWLGVLVDIHAIVN